MRLRYLAFSFSLALMYFSIVLLLPIVVELIYKDWYSILPFIISSAIAYLLSFTLKKLANRTSVIKSINDIRKSEGLCVVTGTWFLGGIIAAVPYLFYGFSPLNAFFEATSGITATGATILTHFDYPNALFFWRSFSQWLGGMGIIVLFIAVLPQFAIAGRQLFSAEAPGPTEDKFTPRIKNTASALWKVYLGLTVCEIILLLANDMSLFDAVCHSFSSVSGGGFSPRGESLIGFSHTILWIITIFMFLAGTSFNLQYKAMTKFNPFILFQNEEFRVYFSFVLVISIALSLSLFLNMHQHFLDSITNAFFTSSSIVSSTGFCSSDFANWDYVSKALLFTLMLFGSCASSAGGGIKVMRWLLIFKIMKIEVIKILHPKAIFNIKIGEYSVSKDILYQTLMFVSFYFAAILLSIFIIGIIEKNTIVAISSSVAAVGNIGPGFGIVGPLGNFDSLNNISKSILIFDMYLGRLELIPILVLFQKEIWISK